MIKQFKLHCVWNDIVYHRFQKAFYTNRPTPFSALDAQCLCCRCKSPVAICGLFFPKAFYTNRPTPFSALDGKGSWLFGKQGNSKFLCCCMVYITVLGICFRIRPCRAVDCYIVTIGKNPLSNRSHT